MFKRDTIALQLYTVRDAIAQDFDSTIRKIGAMGYNAVETAGAAFQSVTVKQGKALFDTLGMAVVAAHSPLPLGDAKNTVLDTMGLLGCEYLVCPSLSADDYFQNVDGIKRGCELLNEASAVARENGLTLVYHNHWWEMALIDGTPGYQHMVKYLDDAVAFEIDTYWVRAGGLNPVDVMNERSGRVPLLHIKDGPATIEDPMLAVGDGVMDFAPIFEASQAKWHIVELDRHDGDMLEAVAKSHRYLMEYGA